MIWGGGKRATGVGGEAEQWDRAGKQTTRRAWPDVGKPGTKSYKTDE